MPTTLTRPVEIKPVHPSERTILLLVNPATFSEDVLLAIRVVCEPTGTDSDSFRDWLLERVVKENGRRQANSDGTDGEPLEVDAWLLPWHQLNDQELAGALAASYSWTGMQPGTEIGEAFSQIHAAVVTAAATRLLELHTAIETAQRRKG